jgi:hypothetical protein
VLEVVVLTVLGVKNVDDDVAVVERDPLTFGPPFFSKGVAAGETSDPLYLFGDGLDLAVVTTGEDHQEIKGVNELSAVQDHGLLGQLVGGALKGDGG